MATALPLTATVTVGGVSGIPKDYYILTRSDGGLTFHLGALGNLTSAPDPLRPYNLGLHHVKITDANGAVLFDQDIPNHWWNGRWTFRPNGTQFTAPGTITANRRMFPMGDTGKAVGTVKAYTYKGPMDSAGITIYMPTTGERPDIGLVTDPSAHFMLTGDAGPMLAWAQAGNTCPFHYRDEATGKPIDLTKYPTANDYNSGNQGSPLLLQGPKNANGASVPGGGWVPQQAHLCEMSYLAYQATKDETILEDLQYAANFVVLCDAGLSSKLHKPTLRGEYRGIGWGARTLFMAHIATKDAEASGKLPSTCHPSSYFKTLLDNALAYYSAALTDPARQTFRLVVLFPEFAPWQVDYMLMALAFGVLTGHSDWTPLYLWALKNAVDRTSGKSGYPPGLGGGYYYNPALPDWDTAYKTGIPGLGGAEPPTAAEAAALAADQFNGGVALRGLAYLFNTRAVLVHAQYLDDNGFANVRALYPDLDNCVSVVNRMIKNSTVALTPRASFVSASVVVPPPVVMPPPVVIQPPVVIPPPTTPTAQQRLDTLVVDINAALKKAGY